ncbi:T9SS type A sorting domain-containing protein [Lewinella sp. IMCC34191]|uniref:glucuronyl esterase domain-containing protein n=1 Tax=Lewinella sp. IMCC34191 TaxID=2259172 RepID=UPI000E247629|nr:T9SS type A sorting domain-containing protein [Lewinella sp. IMCC34191]
MQKMLYRLFFIPLVALLSVGTLQSQDVPLVYDQENTGADCPDPTLPALEDLPVVEPLTDPFLSSDGTTRDLIFANWECRRNEIRAEIEHYEIGEKPGAPDELTAAYTPADCMLTVNVTVGENTLTLTSQIVLPEGDGPFPMVIGMGGPTGSLPVDIFASRDIARMGFNFGQVMAHTQTRGNEPINSLYPDLTYIGAYSAWSWGVSRLIDGLELVAGEVPVDLQHLAVTGCSFAGKMALFASAFDERIALTIAQESGGGGAAAWRVSETLGNVETLGNTSRAWFIEDLFDFTNDVPRLPYDHHELMAMVAPRALLVLGNPDFEWLADESGYVSSRAAHEVWKAFGVEDRFGFSIVGGHGHCALPEVQMPEVEAFVEKFMLGNEDANTDVTVHPYEDVNYERWYEWWGTDDATFPARDTTGDRLQTYEIECAPYIGTDWVLGMDEAASNTGYLTVTAGLGSVPEAPTDSSAYIVLPFSVDTSGSFTVYGRVNCPSADDDSFWVKVDDGDFSVQNGLTTTGWQWERMGSFDLEPGDHELTIAYREDGALLDKIAIQNYPDAPDSTSLVAATLCTVDTTSTSVSILHPADGYTLRQNFPNPFGNQTTIAFTLPTSSYVSLRVFNVAGRQVAELADNVYPAGETTLPFQASGLPDGTYYYTFRAGTYTATGKMIHRR